MKPKEFKYRHFSPEVILTGMRWYLRYPLSYRQLEEMMLERGIEVDRTTLYRWVQKYSPQFEKKLTWYSQPFTQSWRVDETYIRVKGQWKYLYRAVDAKGNTLDFMLSHKRDIQAAKRFFKKVLKSVLEPTLKITTDKHAPYVKAITDLQKEGLLSQSLEHRQTPYLNNVIESDHRRIKRRIRLMMGFKSFHTAHRCLRGIEAMAIMIKQQTPFLKSSLLEQIQFIKNLFQVHA